MRDMQGLGISGCTLAAVLFCLGTGCWKSKILMVSNFCHLLSADSLLVCRVWSPRIWVFALRRWAHIEAVADICSSQDPHWYQRYVYQIQSLDLIHDQLPDTQNFVRCCQSMLSHGFRHWDHNRNFQVQDCRIGQVWSPVRRHRSISVELWDPVDNHQICYLGHPVGHLVSNFDVCRKSSDIRQDQLACSTSRPGLWNRNLQLVLLSQAFLWLTYRECYPHIGYNFVWEPFWVFPQRSLGRWSGGPDSLYS